LIRSNGFQTTVIVGHSSDDDLTVQNKFKLAGADYFETKPPVLKNFTSIIEKIV
jgi:hypothetical protein